MIDIAVLGTGAMMPTATRWLSSFLVRSGEELILFDIGEGTQIPWREQGWGLRKMSLICTSHWHADHIAGLPGALHALANANRTDPVTILGPRGTRTVVQAAREIAVDLPFEVCAADLSHGDRWQWGNMTISVAQGDHRVPVLAYRFDVPRKPRFLVDRAEAKAIPKRSWPRLADGEDVADGDNMWSAADFLGDHRRGLSFGIMTDTRPTDRLAEHFQDLDLLIAEGTYGDDADKENAVRNKHLTFRETASFAARIKPTELVLTHFSPKMAAPEQWIKNATDVFPSTRVANQGEVITLSFPDD